MTTDFLDLNSMLIDEDIGPIEEYLKNPLHTIKFSNLDLLSKRAERVIAQLKLRRKNTTCGRVITNSINLLKIYGDVS